MILREALMMNEPDCKSSHICSSSSIKRLRKKNRSRVFLGGYRLSAN